MYEISLDFNEYITCQIISLAPLCKGHSALFLMGIWVGMIRVGNATFIVIFVRGSRRAGCMMVMHGSWENGRVLIKMLSL